VTLVITTHYMDEAEQLCDRLLVMDNGRIAASGSPRELIEQWSTREVVELRFDVDGHQHHGEKLADLAERVGVAHGVALSSGTAALHLALLLVGVGLGVVFGCALNTATYGADPADAGVASALVNTNQQVGGSVGTALLNTIAASALTSYVLAHGRGPLVLAEAAVHSYVVAFWVSAAILAGSAVVGGLPLYAILSLPILFAAGMCTFDTLDGCFMNFAYDWAFANPVRKVFYNLTITGLSVAVAFFVGSIEILGLIGQEANLSSPFWDFFRDFNINTAGFVIVGLFVATWVVALLYWRLARVEEKWSSALVHEAREEVMSA